LFDFTAQPNCPVPLLALYFFNQGNIQVFGLGDFRNLPNWFIYLKLMITGTASRPFRGNSLDAKYTKQILGHY